MTAWADRVGRRFMLLLGCALMAAAGALFSRADSTTPYWLLVAAATIGVISPTGNEVGPFLALEQSVLTELLEPRSRTMFFSWYNLLG